MSLRRNPGSNSALRPDVQYETVLYHGLPTHAVDSACRPSAGAGGALTAKVLRWNTLQYHCRGGLRCGWPTWRRGCRCMPLRVRADGNRCPACWRHGHPRSSCCQSRHHRRPPTDSATASAAAAAANASAVQERDGPTHGGNGDGQTQQQEQLWEGGQSAGCAGRRGGRPATATGAVVKAATAGKTAVRTVAVPVWNVAKAAASAPRSRPPRRPPRGTHPPSLPQ